MLMSTRSLALDVSLSEEGDRSTHDPKAALGLSASSVASLVWRMSCEYYLAIDVSLHKNIFY